MLLSSTIALSAIVENAWVCLALFTLAYASLSFAGAIADDRPACGGGTSSAGFFRLRRSRG
ncbi:hypothetical protein WI23_23150 [Burkholderia oklahomensis C6786]|nr:hypothetical protein WI23_23150 [Burkholderia oklahomensis C6786]KUY58664.1 hypothetical protein WI23_17375 [Burkholderia oklahomensis C6786]